MKLTIGLIFALTLSAQWLPPQPARFDGKPNNPYPKYPQNYDLTPNSKADTGACVKTIHPDGTTEPTVGVSVTLQGYPTLGSGYHSHELQSFPRPNPTIFQAFSQLTDSTGCAIWQNFTWPRESGWWTLQYLVPVTGTTPGFNFYLAIGSSGYSPTISRTNQLADLPERLLSGSAAVFHPETRTNPDNRHSGFSRYMAPLAGQRMDNSAKTYKALMTTLYPSGTGDPNFNLLNVLRASLPSGGLADNRYVGNVQGEWQANRNEQPPDGNGADVLNPNYVDPGGGPYVALLSAIHQNGCNVGRRDPDATADMAVADAESYWRTQIWVHLDCSTVTFGRPVGGGGR